MSNALIKFGNLSQFYMGIKRYNSLYILELIWLVEKAQIEEKD
jgi:hypothetical protein